MGTIMIIVLIFVIPGVFLLQWILSKLNIPRAEKSRAKIVQKRIYDGPPQAGLFVAPKSIKPI